MKKILLLILTVVILYTVSTQFDIPSVIGKVSAVFDNQKAKVTDSVDKLDKLIGE